MRSSLAAPMLGEAAVKGTVLWCDARRTNTLKIMDAADRYQLVEGTAKNETWLLELLEQLEVFREETLGRPDHFPVGCDTPMLNDQSSSLVLFAIVDDQPAALILGKLSAQTADLHALYVQPAVRRSGIGRSLVLEFLDWAETARDTARVFVDRENDDAVRFYESLGFRQVGTAPRDQVVLTRELTTTPK